MAIRICQTTRDESGCLHFRIVTCIPHWRIGYRVQNQRLACLYQSFIDDVRQLIDDLQGSAFAFAIAEERITQA